MIMVFRHQAYLPPVIMQASRLYMGRLA